MKSLKTAFVIITVCALAGCGSGPSKVFESKAAQTLSSGIDNYNEGRFPEAVKNLQSALDQGLGVSNQVKAHKFLAFTHCVNGRERLCRDEFRKALDINSDLELEPAEAGHPLWGPVFRSAKAKKPDLKK